MNPSNPFGSPQGGAFQATSNTMKTGLFQPFGQQNTNNKPQAMGFFPTSAFGQPSVLNQPSPHGNSIFGQSSSFGQPPSQPPSQTPAFGQQQVGMNNPGFGGSTAPAFGQMSGANQSTVFGQKPAFGQPSAFGQAPGFGQQAPGFGDQPSGFGNSQMASGSTTNLGKPQPLGFGQTVFGQPSSTSVGTSVFGAITTQSRSFGSEFSFKPANEALFKPIFSASPEPANPQTTSLSSSPFAGSAAQTISSTMSSGSTTSGFSILTGAKSGSLGFSFSQPAATPSISAQNNPLTTGSGSGPTSTLQFTFSQPAAPSSSSTKAPSTQPTTPSSFSFTANVLQPQTTPLFGGNGSDQPSAFSDIKAKAETNTDGKGSSIEGLGEANVFARLGKATKRKDDPAFSSTGPEPAAGDDETTERQPPKRPLMRSRGPTASLFGRALSGLRKDVPNPVRREAKDSQPQALEVEATEKGDVQAQDELLTAAPPAASPRNRDVPEKVEKPDPVEIPEPKVEPTTPLSRDIRSESSESLGGTSPTDCTTIQCRNVPPALNKKEIIEKHFARFGKVCKVFCRVTKNTAIVHFDNHASAAKAKKRGKILKRHELLLLWMRKKQSPGDKGSRPAAGTQEIKAESQEEAGSKAGSSPLRRPPLGTSAVSSTLTFSRGSPVKKPSMVKSLQFESEPKKESAAEAQSAERPVLSSLLHLAGQVAETAEDKYRLLEQRDKILRQGQPKRTDLDLSKVFVGTCPDMCPEKERYMRETRNQLSMYEVVLGTEMVDHAAAIKEYSRSSADQEEPLPHELRPLPVLSMTMDYLVTQIMEQGLDNYRDWYDFVWNRTRGIRKDIIQQHLCCPNTVSLIEKCTRFHVHCAHHLCEEHMASFDAKINNENMTKCLQSLKEMYEDLKTHHIYCPLEAEFRQYNVLLRLNDGDILRDVQQFRDEVRNSPEVKFAVQAFAAVNSNNFVRFFKLVKGASYLASCLLHRYFNQVRSKALKTLNMAHTVGPRSTTFPVEDIVRMLMFCDAAEATDFIQQYGLNVSDGMVELSRIAYQEPELPLSQKKSEVILAKRNVLIGEVVNGGPLPNPPQHTPVCSFDANNKYSGEGPQAVPPPNQFKAVAVKVEVKAPPSTEALTQEEPVRPPDVPSVLPPVVTDETGEPCQSFDSSALPADAQQLLQPVLLPPPVKPPSPAPKPLPVYSDEDIMAEVDGVIDELVDAAVREVAAAGAGYAATALEESSAQLESLVAEVLGQMAQEVSSTEIRLEQERVAEEKRKLEEARRRQEHEAFLDQFSFSFCTELIYEVLDETIRETAGSVIQQAVDEKAQRVATCTEQVCSELVEETLDADIALMVGEILEVQLQRIHKYIKRWRDVVALRRQLKRQMRGFPAAPCFVDPRLKLRALAPSAPTQPVMEDLARGLVNLGNAGTLSLSSIRLLRLRQEVVHQLRVQHFYQRLLNELVWAPLNLPALVTKHLPDPPERIFWKAVLLLPSDHESVASLADSILSDWLEMKLGGGKGSEVVEEQPDGTLQTLCVSNTLQENQQRTHNVHISVKVSRGPLSEDGLARMEECCELQGTGALIMLLPALPAVESGLSEQDVPLLSALLQLKQLQQVNTWHCPLPLLILVAGPGGGDTQRLEEDLMLQTLVKDGLISEYTFLFIPETTSDLQGSKQLNHALHWLLARAPPSLPLSCLTLVQLVESSLSREFSPRVLAHRQERASARLPPQDPEPVIQLYNAVLDHIANKVSSQDLSGLSWPPTEFCLPDTRESVPPLGWNSASHLAWIRNTIISLQLPQWRRTSAGDSWSELCAAISGYAAQIPGSRCSRPLLNSRLENLLERVRLKGQRTRISRSKVTVASWADPDENVYPVFHQIPWDDVVAICIDHKLKDWQIPGPPACEDAVTEDGEILVYYPPDSLMGFQPPKEWTEAVRQTHQEKQQEDTGASAAACAPPTIASLRQRLFHNLAEPVKPPPTQMDISHTPTAEELLAHQFLQGVEEERAESKRSLQQFQRWLDGDASDHWSTSLFIPSSTLLSSSTPMMHRPAAKTGDAMFTEAPDEPGEPSQTARWMRAPPVSMVRRLQDFQQQIAASQEEELACRLKLNGMLGIVDD
ncbi:germinal-center associated nuclear protein [Aulostomus maculatus]